MAKKPVPAIDNSSRLEFATQSADAFAQSDLLSTEAADRIKDALAKATFDLWEAVRNVWQGKYREVRGADDVASQKAWSRLIAATGLVKPKSTSASSTKNAASVAAKAAALNALKAKTAEGLAVLREDLAQKIATGGPDADAAFKQIRMIDAEKKRREEEAGKAAKDHLKSVRDRVLEMVKKCEDVETLARMEALLAASAQSVVGGAAVAPAPAATPATQKRGNRKAA